MAQTHVVFVYFKAPVGQRERLLELLPLHAQHVSRQAGSQSVCATRVHSPGAGIQPPLTDTWLEHYHCPDASSAERTLAQLALFDEHHPVAACIEGGAAARHIEHFVHLSHPDTRESPNAPHAFTSS